MSFVSSSRNWNFILFRHFGMITCVCIKICRHLRMSTCFCILIFSHLIMSTWVCILIFRITTGFFSNYLSFNIFFILLISNGSSFYRFINFYNIFRSFLNIHTWFLNVFLRNNGIFYFFTHFIHWYSILVLFWNNWCFYLSL